jgi:hypothetical protein
MTRTPVGVHGPSGLGTFVTRAEPEIQRSSRANAPQSPGDDKPRPGLGLAPAPKTRHHRGRVVAGLAARCRLPFDIVFSPFPGVKVRRARASKSLVPAAPAEARRGRARQPTGTRGLGRSGSSAAGALPAGPRSSVTVAWAAARAWRETRVAGRPRSRRPPPAVPRAGQPAAARQRRRRAAQRCGWCRPKHVIAASADSGQTPRDGRRGRSRSAAPRVCAGCFRRRWEAARRAGGNHESGLRVKGA